MIEFHLDAESAQFLAELITAGDEGPTEISLRVGQIQDDDGTVQHGLLVYESEYPEEGASLLVECPPIITLQSHREAIAQHRAAMEESVEALRHLSQNARVSGAEMGLALVVAKDAITHANQVLGKEGA